MLTRDILPYAIFKYLHVPAVSPQLKSKFKTKDMHFPPAPNTAQGTAGATEKRLLI